MVDAPKLSEEEMQMIYNWVDEIPLSRPKRNIARDFSDGGNSTYIGLTFYSARGRDRQTFRSSHC
jgi:CH-like domain in sperm protein